MFFELKQVKSELANARQENKTLKEENRTLKRVRNDFEFGQSTVAYFNLRCKYLAKERCEN